MANNIQPTYADEIRTGFPGMVANKELSNIVSRTVASATLAFGALALKGAADHNVISASAETVEASAPAAQAGNTGNGTFAATPVITAGTPQGAYHLEITDAVTNAGRFSLTGPSGYNEVGNVAAAFSVGGIAFTLQDGATDFVAGDGFTFNVQATSGTDVGAVEGIAVADTTLGAEVANYVIYDTAGILTQGQIWVTAGAAVDATEAPPVYYVAATGRYRGTGGSGTILVNNAQFDDSAAANGDLVRISLRNRNGIA